MKKNEENVVNPLPHVEEKGSIKLRMSLFYDYDFDQLPIEGGWGYGKDDAVVFTSDDAMECIGLEYEIAKMRASQQVYALNDQHPEKDLYFESFHPLKQSLMEIDGTPYDVIEGEVTVLDDDVNATKYRTECWFNIKSFFGKH
ncbi:MAG: hypothetical protein II087_02845 [Muribaculaceae bacterium]|nr:hypothetical protein [Muribaculaceae bacterium]